MTTARRIAQFAARRATYVRRMRTAKTSLDQLVAEYDFLRSILRALPTQASDRQLDELTSTVRRIRTDIVSQNHQERSGS